MAWGTTPYTTALHSMASLHAGWWGKVQDDELWPRLPEIYEPEPIIGTTREALLAIEGEAWTERLLGEGRVSTLLSLVDEPALALDLLQCAPTTLISPDSGTEGQESDRYVCEGPAAYDLAAFYSSTRWLYGRAPLGLAGTRNAYLIRLGSLLNEPIDHALFDITLDAARCWNFVLGWAQTLATRPPALLARAHIFRSAVAEPAFASLSRLQRI
jgi:hypothetical protein